MRFTQTLIRTLREAPKDEESKNAQLLIRAGFVDKLQAGVYTYLPLGERVLNKITDLIRKHMNGADGIEISMPALHNKKPYEITGRWDTMDSLIRFETHWTKTEYALGATHEEVVVPLMKKYIQSYKDLPKSVYQFQTKFRDEKRAKAGLLRGREFLMKDMYSFHDSSEDLDKYYDQMTEVYKKIYDEAGIGNQTYVTLASGGDFSEWSHEFQTICEAGEDTIYICDNCRVAINKEVIDKQKVCPKCGGSKLREDKAIEVGNIFKLNTKFSKPFDLKFKDAEGNDQIAIMGCYGIGLSRLMGAVVELLADSKGLVWPEQIAPFKAHLVGLNLDDAAVRVKVDSFYETLVKEGVEVLYDDRINTQAGEKFADADLIGCPIRITVSKRSLENGQYEMKKRSEENSEMKALGEIGELK